MKVAKAVGIFVLLALAGYGATTLGNSRLDKFREKYMAQGRDLTLQQMAQAAEARQDITVQVGGKTYKFIVVNPAGTAPEPDVTTP